MHKKFIRQDSGRYSRLGKKRKKLQKWRKPRGRDSKMRLKRKSYPSVVSIGYKSPRKDLGKIRGKNPILVHNLNELKKSGKNSIVIIGKIGAKKKLDLIKYASENKIEIHNLGGKNEA